MTHLSVVIPLYNKENYLLRCINSVLSQTHVHFELLVVNDGSTDGSLDILSSIKDNRVLVVNQINKGVSSARNTGIQRSKYDYIFFLDADDVWEPFFLEKMVDLIYRYPSAKVYGANNYFYNVRNCRKYYDSIDWLFADSKDGLIDDYFSIFLRLSRSPFSSSNFGIHKSVYLETNGYLEGVSLTEDSEFWSRLALKYKIAYTTTPLSTYYLGTEGSTHFRMQSEVFEVEKSLEQLLDQREVPDFLVGSVKKFIAFQRVSFVKRSLLGGHKVMARRRLVESSILKEYPFKYAMLLLVSFVPKIVLVLALAILRRDRI